MGAFFSDQIGPIPAVALMVLALVCTVTDLWKGKIYNAVTYPTALLGLGLQIWLRGADGLVLALGGFAVGFFPAFLMFALGGLQGGDVKLLGAVGVLAGPVPTTQILVVALLFGGLLGVMKLAWHGVLFARLLAGLRFFAGALVPGVPRKPMEPDERSQIRFGFAISVAILLVLWSLKSGGVLAAVLGA